MSRLFVRAAITLDVFARRQLAERSGLVKLLLGLLAARGLISASHGDG